MIRAILAITLLFSAALAAEPPDDAKALQGTWLLEAAKLTTPELTDRVKAIEGIRRSTHNIDEFHKTVRDYAGHLRSLKKRVEEARRLKAAHKAAHKETRIVLPVDRLSSMSRQASSGEESGLPSILRTISPRCRPSTSSLLRDVPGRILSPENFSASNTGSTRRISGHPCRARPRSSGSA